MSRFVGIDVAQASLAIAVRPGGAAWTCANDEGGHTPSWWPGCVRWRRR